MDLSLIIVNFNAKPDLLRCLKTLETPQGGLDFEVIVVDNGSADGSLEAAESAYPGGLFVQMGGNRGFAAACNAGIRQSRGRHVMLLNPDTEVQPGALRQLVDALDRHPGWGVAGPRMVDQHDQIYPAARRFPTPFFLFCECTRLMHLFPRTRLFAGYVYGERDPAALDRVDQIEGSALVLSQAARDKVGQLDERFFLFFEEVDWCRRVAAAGFEIHVVQSAVIRHHRSTTMSRFYVEARKAHAASAMQYFQKHYGDAGLAALRRWMIAALWIRIFLTSLAELLTADPLPRLRADGARAELRVYRAGIVRRD